MSNCYAEAFGYDNNNRQRGNDEPNAPLLVEVDGAAEEVDMVVGAGLDSGATSAPLSSEQSPSAVGFPGVQHMGMEIWLMKLASLSSAERATERVAVLMTPREKATFADRASCMGLSLGQFFREAGAAYANSGQEEVIDSDALDAALNQLEISTTRTEAVLDSALAEIRAALLL